ncbi:MAG: hypothetical protein WC775_03845 [Patescibacteria group bacterium]|jgi:hypothetical protein
MEPQTESVAPQGESKTRVEDYSLLSIGDHLVPEPTHSPIHNDHPQVDVAPLLQPPPPTYKAVFTHQITDALTRCGINVNYVNPVPIGAGANHVVYRLSEPGMPERVIKLGKILSVTTMTYGRDEEHENVATARSYFKDYSAATEVKSDPLDNSFFCLVQELVKGQPLSNISIKGKPELQRQLADIVRCNNGLYRHENMSLDFIGMSGLFSWIKSQITRLLLRKSEFLVSNIFIDPDGRLKIIDFEYFKFKDHVPLGRRFLNFIGFSMNRILMRHYFGLDIKKPRPSPP